MLVLSSPIAILQDHIEGYHELSAKTQAFFTTAVAKWDAEFYVKVDDDVHVNLGTTLSLYMYLLSLCALSFRTIES